MTVFMLLLFLTVIVGFFREPIYLVLTEEQPPLPEDVYYSTVWNGWTIVMPQHSNWIQEGQSEIIGLAEATRKDGVKLDKFWNIRDFSGPVLLDTPKGVWFFNNRTKTLVMEGKEDDGWTVDSSPFEFGIEHDNGTIAALFKRDGRVVWINYDLAPAH